MELKDLEQKENLESHEFLETSREWRRLFAEFWGTFLLVLVAAGGSMVAKQHIEITKEMEAIAPGLIVMVVIFAIGAVSGAHINPSVTLAFALRRHFPWKRVPFYIIAQILGGIVAVLFLKYIVGGDEKLGATVPDSNLEDWRAFVVEILLTTGLVNVILGTASGPRNIGNNGAIAIGGYIALAGLWAAPLTGASMNLVRSLAPDIVRGDFETTWIYVLGTLTGGFIAVGLEWILKGQPSKKADTEAQGSSAKDEKS